MRICSTFLTAAVLCSGSLALEPAEADDTSSASRKWAPYGVIQGEAGSDVIGSADLFAPLWQDSSSMLFGDLRGTIDDDENVQGHAGVGYRHLFGDWLAGVYGYFDVIETEHDHTFLQGSAGIEFMTEDWEFRINGYVPEREEKKVDDYRLTLVSSGMGGQTLRFRDRRERAFNGGDLELGWRPPLFCDCENAELRVFAGGFYHDAGGYDALAGPNGRVELRLFDLPLLPKGSRLTAGGEVRWDDERGTWGAALLRLRIPFNFFGLGGEKLAGMDRRMIDRPVRQGVVTRTRHTDRVPMTPGGVPVGDVAYADGDTMGDARSVPTAGEIETAIGVAGTGGIIVALDQTGPIDPLNDNQTIELLPGQVLMGGGSSVTLTNGGLSGVFNAPGGRGLFQTALEIPHIRLMDDNQLIGVDIDGGYNGVQVFGNRVSIYDIGITNTASTATIVDYTAGVSWSGNDGIMEQVSIGNVSSVDDVTTSGVRWSGNRGTMRDVTIGNVTSVNSIASGLNWSGDAGAVENVVIGNVSSANDEARGIWLSTDGSAAGSVLDNLTLGNVTSTNGHAWGLHWFQLNDGTGSVSNVTIGNVRGGNFADGIQWWHGAGTLTNIVVGNVTADDGSANGLYSLDMIGGTADGLTIGNVSGSALGGGGSGAGIRLFGSDGVTVRNATIGDVSAVTFGTGFGMTVQDGDDISFDQITVGNVTGNDNVLTTSGIGFSAVTNSTATNLTIGNVTAFGVGQEFSAGAAGINFISSSNVHGSDITIGNVLNVDDGTAWARGIVLTATGSSVRRVIFGNVTATAPSATAIGVDFQSSDSSTIEDVQAGNVTGSAVATTFALRFNDVINAIPSNNNVANRIVFGTVNGNGILFSGGTNQNDTGTGNSGTLLGLGVVPCIDTAADTTGSAVVFNVTTCP